MPLYIIKLSFLRERQETERGDLTLSFRLALNIATLRACTTTPGRTDQVSSIKDSVNQARWHPPVFPAFWEAKQEADTS